MRMSLAHTTDYANLVPLLQPWARDFAPGTTLPFDGDEQQPTAEITDGMLHNFHPMRDVSHRAHRSPITARTGLRRSYPDDRQSNAYFISASHIVPTDELLGTFGSHISNIRATQLARHQDRMRMMNERGLHTLNSPWYQ